ncbi:outer membrane protein assembly factor BamA [Arenimonas sp.]|uniref:outer membrane protein assembly factor BamA n=1 Tax=Arenimonas sp. TaxID=1872635 RepID=UPI0039E5B6EA
MTRNNARRRLLALALAAALSGQAFAQNFEAFTVSDIRIDGLQRISAGTVFTYLPVERGDQLDRNKANEAIRALFRTGFFSDVKLDRQGGILVVSVTERPAINTLSIEGNKEIKTEDLMKGIKSIGLSEGETYNPLNLDRLTQELTRQYNNRGKYGVIINPEVTTLDRNRVDLKIMITEGKPAKIRDINIVGNNVFAEGLVRRNWESGTTNWLSWYKRDDQYSREKLSGDLEKLSNYYLDRGYVDFNLESTQISISPSKQDMYITANITEGEMYKVSEAKVSGETILPQEEIEKLVMMRAGSVFSRALVELTNDTISTTLANLGYAHASVNPIPEVDRANKTVAVNFVVQPGPRVQVRRILFKGNSNTADEVLRREMRQFEATWYSQAAIDRSKIRLQRLGYFETVEVDTPEVPGRPDQVDVVVTVKERNAGSFTFGVGYSQYGGLITSVQLQQNNFLGSGNRFSVGVQNNTYSRSISFSYIDPYFTDDGISVGYGLSYSDYDTSTTTTARYSAGNAAGEVSFGIPLSENTSISTAFGIYRNQITTTDGLTPLPVVYYLVDSLGDRQRTPIVSTVHTDDDGDEALGCGTTGKPACTPRENDDGDLSTIDPLPLTGGNRQWTVNAWTLKAGWAIDTRDSYLFPTRGTLHRLSGEIALPGSDLEYYRLNYEFEKFWPLTPWLIMRTSVDVGYGDSYGNTAKQTCYDHTYTGAIIAGTGQNCGLPFFKHFYAGGPGSVRGFQANTLGPNYEVPGYGSLQPLGGPIKTTGSVEFYLPRLFSGPGARISAFVDYGNVFGARDDFAIDKFRVTTGIALQWQSPMGPISISFAVPIRKEEGDQVERLQFTFGNQQ